MQVLRERRFATLLHRPGIFPVLLVVRHRVRRRSRQPREEVVVQELAGEAERERDCAKVPAHAAPHRGKHCVRQRVGRHGEFVEEVEQVDLVVGGGRKVGGDGAGVENGHIDAL